MLAADGSALQTLPEMTVNAENPPRVHKIEP